VADATAREGARATVTIRLSRRSTQAVTVSYATRNATARAGADYKAVSGTLAFASGQTAKSVSIRLLRDRLAERNERFALVLRAPGHAVLGRARATVTIRD
jgi:hypothetical protein